MAETLTESTTAPLLRPRQSTTAPFLEMTSNLAVVAVSAFSLMCTVEEKPNVPVRVWICGFALQCALHVVLVWLKYRRRNQISHDEEIADENDVNLIDSKDDEGKIGAVSVSKGISYTKRFETLNAMVSFVWWLIGIYWMVSGGEILLHQAPHLYWVTVVFLAFNALFAIFCVALACLMVIAVCCCLPSIIFGKGKMSFMVKFNSAPKNVKMHQTEADCFFDET